jgi:hypothetical protein
MKAKCKLSGFHTLSILKQQLVKLNQIQEMI